MARGAIYAAHIYVPRMIELHAKTSEARKRFQRTRFHVRMTDGADGTLSLGKLLRVTTCTRQVIGSTRAAGHRGVRLAAMAEQARQARVISGVMLKLRIVETFGKLHLDLGRLRLRER